MSKILDATCSAAGVVTADGVPVNAAEVQSEGKQSSSGLLIMDGEKAWYLPSSATDIKTDIEKEVDALGAINDALTAIGEGLTQITQSITAIAAVAGPAWAPPPTLATDVVTIVSKVATITAKAAVVTTKITDLNTLKGSLK